MSEAGLHCRNT